MTNQTSSEDKFEQILDAVTDNQSSDSNPDIEDKTPSFVWDRFSSKWEAEGKSSTGLQTYRSSWGQFERWMESKGYQYLTDLGPFFPDRYSTWIIQHDDIEKKPISRRMHLSRIQNVLRTAKTGGYLPTDIPADGSWDEVKPDLKSAEAKIRNDPLLPERGKQILKWLEETRPYSRSHVLWILLFKYGFRVSAIRALDLGSLCLTKDDAEGFPDSREFSRHLCLEDRPNIGPSGDGLPLKNSRSKYADRLVPLHPADVDALDMYVQLGGPTGAKDSRKEFDRLDKFGLKGLITTESSPRISDTTIRTRCHWLTCPTTYGKECDCEGCREYRKQEGTDPSPTECESVCNMSASPHQVRHGAITLMLDDNTAETVASVVGTSPSTLRDVYDRASKARRLERTRDDFVSSSG
jgi:integrase